MKSLSTFIAEAKEDQIKYEYVDKLPSISKDERSKFLNDLKKNQKVVTG